ncbi:MAG: CDP-alcohol phosphatidyltransferase family protein [Deltaproteobacteria bacterium]|nr:CDP-alcohol phosphatidyltransferase family protein [Deltaproteobacteria bacterium]
MEIKGDALEKKLAQIRDQTEGWVARWINKPVSFALTRRLLKTPVTPNQITAVNLLLAGTAAFCLSRLEYGWRVLGAFLMYFSSIIDGCDGEVARLKGLCSKFGAWFDTIADDFSNNLFFAAIFIGLFWSTGNPLYWKLGGIALLLSLGVTAVIYHQLITGGESANAKDFALAWREKEAGKKGLVERLKPAVKRDFFIAVIFLCVILDLRQVFFWFGVVAACITFALCLFSFLTQVYRDFLRSKT